MYLFFITIPYFFNFIIIVYHSVFLCLIRLLIVLFYYLVQKDFTGLYIVDDVVSFLVVYVRTYYTVFI